MPSAGEAALLALAALLGGSINAVAGGGSFLTFPALVFTGTAPLVANATSTVALWPASVASAFGYRRELREEKRLALELGAVSLLGGVLGALGVIATPQDVFVKVLPFLLLVATLVFTFGEKLRARLGWVGGQGAPPFAVVVIAQFVVALYGGYFGGGMGLMMLALFALLGARRAGTDIHTMNALKSALGVAINATALLTFVLAGKVDWGRALIMTSAAVIGGYGVAAVARRIDARKVKTAVIVLGWVMTAAFFVRTFG